jgi:hypothetical protein
MALDARPSPREIGAWLVGDVSEAALAVCLATLQADPNWRVIARGDGAHWALELRYMPVGETSHLRLVWVVQASREGWWRQEGVA